MSVGRVFVVLAVVLLVCSLVLPWVKVDTAFLRAKITLQDADKAYKVFRETYIKTVCNLEKSDLKRIACILDIPSYSPFQLLMGYIVFLAFFTLIAVLDRVLAVFQGLFILVFSLVLYNKTAELIAGPLAPIVKGFVEPELGFYAFAAAGFLALIGGLLGWSIKPRSRGDALLIAALVGATVFLSAVITYIGISYIINMEPQTVGLAAVITALIAVVADYSYRATKIKK